MLARSKAARIEYAESDGEGVLLKAPLYALPIGVRAVETITALLIIISDIYMAE